MVKSVRVIGCISSQVRQQIVFRSMIRIFSQGPTSNLKMEWAYSDEGPCDVRILDLDDDSNLELASAGGPGVLAFISSNPQRLEGRDFALSKPLRGQDFLQLLQRLESVVSS